MNKLKLNIPNYFSLYPFMLIGPLNKPFWMSYTNGIEYYTIKNKKTIDK